LRHLRLRHCVYRVLKTCIPRVLLRPSSPMPLGPASALLCPNVPYSIRFHNERGRSCAATWLAGLSLAPWNGQIWAGSFCRCLSSWAWQNVYAGDGACRMLNAGGFLYPAKLAAAAGSLVHALHQLSHLNTSNSGLCEHLAYPKTLYTHNSLKPSRIHATLPRRNHRLYYLLWTDVGAEYLLSLSAVCLFISARGHPVLFLLVILLSLWSLPQVETYSRRARILFWPLLAEDGVCRWNSPAGCDTTRTAHHPLPR